MDPFIPLKLPCQQVFDSYYDCLLKNCTIALKEEEGWLPIVARMQGAKKREDLPAFSLVK